MDSDPQRFEAIQALAIAAVAAFAGWFVRMSARARHMSWPELFKDLVACVICGVLGTLSTVLLLDLSGAESLLHKVAVYSLPAAICGHLGPRFLYKIEGKIIKKISDV